MFAVKGWAVAADSLKAETASSSSHRGSDKPAAKFPDQSKKRKRAAEEPDVTPSNLAQLWETVIEKKPVVERGSSKLAGKSEGAKEAKSKRTKEPTSERSAETLAEKFKSKQPAKENPPDEKHQGGSLGSKKKRKEKKRDKQDANDDNETLAPRTENAAKRKAKKETQAHSAHEVEEHSQKTTDRPNKKKKTRRDEQELMDAARQILAGLSPDIPDLTEPKRKSKDKKDLKSAKASSRQSVEGTSMDGANSTYAKHQAKDAPTLNTTQPPARTGSFLPATEAKLTPLQASMRDKLISARFRSLNETLYTRPSAESLRLFADEPDLYDEYHEGFRRQVRVWPENPVDSFIQDVRERAKPAAPSLTVLPLPRAKNGGVCTIADLGCGDARLAATLLPDAKRLRLKLLSFDLRGNPPLVTRADVANLPLPDDAVDVAVFCLALMGTNWLDFVEEAHRVLRWKGELWVAEIKSRFGRVGRARPAGNAAGKPVEHSVGQRRKKGTMTPATAAGAKKAEEAQVANDQVLAVEVDGADDVRQETDVSAFVGALLARGFVLQGAADLSNKMFVKMRFVKSAVPTRGKGAAAGQEPHRERRRFIEADDGAGQVDESGILKPCLYKTR